MLSKTLILAAAASSLLAGAAFAQNTAAPSYPDKTSTPPDKIQSSPSAPATGLTPSAQSRNNQGDVSANVSDTTSISNLPAGSTLTNQLVTNGPVPDTKENRAKFGAPESRAGKMTRAKGN